MVVVLGDLTSTADTTREFATAETILASLDVPYVPVIGNHDMVPCWVTPRVPPRDSDSLYTTRYFEKWFGPQYGRLADSGFPQIRDFQRYEEHPWNFEIHWPFPCDDTFAYDIWQNFSFRAGPEQSPYRFVCLDFNSRDKVPDDNSGMFADGDLHKLPFDNKTSSVRVRGGAGTIKARTYDEKFFQGDSHDITASEPDLGDWRGRISSVRVFAEGCTVDLYESMNYGGNSWLRLTASDSDLSINGSAQWWRELVRASCDTSDTIRDNVIFFAHHPLTSVDPLGIGNFGASEVGDIASFLAPYACDVGGWYAGHLVDSGKWYSPPFHGEVKSDGTKVCDWYITPESNHYGGYVKILTLYYDKAPLVDLDCSGLIDDTVDVTYEDSIRVEVTTLRMGYLTARIWKGGQLICTLAESLARGQGRDADTLTWDGRDSRGALALPGSDYSVRFTEGNAFMGSSPFTVKGTCLPMTTGARADTWDTLHEPYVLTGHDFTLDSEDSTELTILSGVRVMFHDMSKTGEGNHGLYVENNCRIEALGTAQDSVYFMPHRKMAVVSSPQDSGWWGELHLEGQSYGATFSHCVFENGGGNARHQAVLFAHSPDSPSRIEVSGCHFLGAMCHAISDTGTARNLIDIDSCVFEGGGGFPLYKVAAPQVGRVSANSIFLRNGYNNAYNGMLVLAEGDIDTADTWHNCDTTGAGFFYQIDDGGDLFIESALHIDPGVKLRFGSKNHIITRNGGSIVAEGTSSAPIVFEGIDGASWPGIELRSGDHSSFTYCTFRDSINDPELHGGIYYYPQLYCNKASPTLDLCTFENARVRDPHDNKRGTGLYMHVEDSPPSITRCMFSSNEVGILARFEENPQTCMVKKCVIEGGDIGYLVQKKENSRLVGICSSFVFDHYDSGVVNLVEDETVYARHNCWGRDSGGLPGRGSNDTAYGNVLVDSAWTDWDPIFGHDAAARSIVLPSIDMEPGEVVPTGVAQNNCCDQETLMLTMRIGTAYADTVIRVFDWFSSDTVEFRPCTLDVDTYEVVFKVTLAGDEIPANDSLVRTVYVAWTPGWKELTPLPEPPSGRPIKEGGCLAYDSGTGLVYAAKGNKTQDFYSFDVASGGWSAPALAAIPLGSEGKKPRKGTSLCADGNGKLYLTKGNNTLGFWEYDASQDAWTQKANVPIGGGKKVKDGAALAWATKDDIGAVYLLKGQLNEFYKYDPVRNTWVRLLDAPIGPYNHRRWRDGSWLVSDGDHTLYAFKAQYNELYTYDTDADTWSQAKSGMPLGGSAGRKKAGYGSCGAWFRDRLYALKGFNTTEFWRYIPGGNFWEELENVPLVGKSGERKKVKAGGALAANPGTGVFAFKGNRSLEFWRYVPAQESTGGPALLCASGGAIIPTLGGPALGGEEPLMDGLEASKPRWNWQGTWVCYVKTDTLTDREQIYQCQYGTATPEQRVVDLDEDCEEPVYSPDGQYIAFQLDDTVSGFYQLCVTHATDSGMGGGGLSGRDSDPAGTMTAVAPDRAQAPSSALGVSATVPAESKPLDPRATEPTSSSASRRPVCAGPGLGGVAASLGPVWQITYAYADHCYPEWSPDGEWLCYERDDDSGYTQIWRVPAFGGPEQQLTFGNSDHFLPGYLNLHEIVFTLSPNNDYAQIAKVHDSTLQVTVLSSFNTDHDKPSSSWDGSDVAAEALDDYCNTQVVRLMGANGETWLTSGDADIMEPDFGQDNRTVFAVRWTGITSQIVWVDAENGGYTAVTDSLAIRDNPDARVDTLTSTALAVYEREAADQMGLLLGGRRRKHGAGVYLSKSRKPRRTDADGAQGAGLAALVLDKAKPNPATGRVTIRWQVPVEADVSLRVYNTAGQLTKVLAGGRYKPGAYTSVWNGTDAKGRRMANGVYFFALDNGVGRISRKVVLTD